MVWLVVGLLGCALVVLVVAWRDWPIPVAVLGVMAVAAGAFVLWWRSGPSPEAEVEEFLASQGSGASVIVRDCALASDPGDSVFTDFNCRLEISRRVEFTKEEVLLTPGSRIVCFDVPRAAPRDWRSDRDASLLYPGRCSSG